MTSSKPNAQSSRKAPPPPRRSARQQRLANRAANRELARAGTRGGGGGDMRTLVMWTLAAVVIGAVVIGGAWYLTQPKNADGNVPSLLAPGVTTPPTIVSSGRTLGKATAPVTIDLWSDFRCTGCFAFYMDIEPEVETKLVATGQAKLVYHDLILIDQGGVTESRDAANASICAADQGKFWPYHDWLFANQSPEEAPGYMTLDRLVGIGRSIPGMDMATFEPCVRKGSHLDQVTAERAAFGTGTLSTPTVYVNGKLVENANNPQAIPTFNDIKKAVDAVLNPASPSPSASATAAPTASPS